MIDMQGIFSHSDYNDTVKCFKDSDCNWNLFQSLHKNVSNNKCPICEAKLDDTSYPSCFSTIDHFRPKAENMYPYLKCEPDNYILMCSLCNSRYKKSKFPLISGIKRAKTIKEIVKEQPLLFNPAKEKPLDFFELAFRQTQVGNILELKRKNDVPKDSDKYQRCEAMIQLFGLGYIHKDIHPNEETKNLRLDILTAHYETFIQLAQDLQDGNKKSAALFLKDRKEELKKYGFYQFLMKKQFHVY